MDKNAKPGQDLKDRAEKDVYPTDPNKGGYKLRYNMATGRVKYKTNTKGGAY
jgi:hypothetical protein